MPSSRWKAVESIVCEILCTLPPEEKERFKELVGKKMASWRNLKEGVGGQDCNPKVTSPYAVQVRHRDCPLWLLDAVETAKRDASDTQLPLVALHPKGKSIDETLIIIRLDDFREWFI